ncbi:hypothetical protein FOZ60_004378 [Perkinsus olseni]|uniref:Uncharacterized protein n=1 Tax=Perkinsus olseni TaxID=32597 RepID=A0A7J6NTZ0_PEROL|nr:hypothetical protein FOZ60_004378 [Perkinsus olseni]
MYQTSDGKDDSRLLSHCGKCRTYVSLATSLSEGQNSEELAHYFYHGLSDRVKHKLISEIKEPAIYKDLDRLKDITRHVCRVLSEKAKTKSPSTTALDLQEETVDISRPFFNRSLRQAGANNVEATITNGHMRTFKCQRGLSNDHSTVLCPASDVSLHTCRSRTCGMVNHPEGSAPCPSLMKGPITCVWCSGQGHFARACQAKELRPMPVEQRKLIFDRVKAKRTPTTRTAKDSQVNLVALSTSMTRSNSSLTNVDIYLSTDNKLRYKQPARVDSGHAATSSDGSKDPMPIDTAVVLPVTFFTTEGTTITIKCYVYPALSHQMLLSSSVPREAGCLWFMLPGYADCMLLGIRTPRHPRYPRHPGSASLARPLERSSTLAPDHLSLNCLSLQALCYDGLDTNWECTHRLMSCTLQLGTSNDGPESSDLFADEQEALRRWKELANCSVSYVSAADRGICRGLREYGRSRMMRDASRISPVLRVPRNSELRPPVNSYKAKRCDLAIMRKIPYGKREDFRKKIYEFVLYGFCNPTTAADSDAQLEAYMESVRDEMEKGRAPPSSSTGRFIRAL